MCKSCATLVECKFCRGLVLEASPGLFKCSLCGQYFRENPTGPLPKLEVVATLERLKAHEAGIETEAGLAEGVGADKMIFADLVAKRLVSTEGLTPEMLPQVKKVQEGFRNELIEVLQGKRGLYDWVSKTKTNLGLHKTKVLTILYESLDGLKDPELIELQEFCGKALETGVM